MVQDLVSFLCAHIFLVSLLFLLFTHLCCLYLQVQLNLTVKAFLYNTTEAYYKCTFTQGSCSMNILFPKGNAAVLTSPGLEQVRVLFLCISNSM